jgi:dsRNA-specific ribonuclease
MDQSQTGKQDEEAWIGDAVLTLYARSLILQEDLKVDGPKCVRMTSNQFLRTRGEPTKVEAELGRLYQREGLEAAFRWIEATLLPVFRKQEENRTRKSPKRND